MKSLFRIWVPPIVFFCAVLWLLYAFAHNRQLGFPDEPEKNVSLVPPEPTTGDLGLRLQPPMETRQMAGESQKLALEFSNRTKDRSIEVLPVKAEPSECFTLEPEGTDKPTTQSGSIASGKDGNLVLEGGATAVKMERLSFAAACVGQEHPLTLIYRWQPMARESARSGAKGRQGKQTQAKQAKGKRKSAVQTQVTPPRIEERAISTTPIRITSTPLNEKERFIRINRMVLLPLMAALVTVLFQSFQVGRDAAQKAETLKIEVWKTVQPSFLHMVKNYYSPLLRRTDGIRTQIADDGSTQNLLALMFALRRQMLLLLEKDAGYYFQSKPGEELIGLLSNAMVKRWRAEIPDFDGIALKLQGNETLEATREILTNPNSPQAGPAQSLNCGLVAWLESARSAQAGASTEQTQGNTTAPTIAPLTHTAAVDLVTLSSFLDATAGETQKKALEFFKHSLRLFAEVLSFELDRPFYPVWYEKGFPPTVQLAELEGRADKLTWYPKDGRVALADALEIYRMSIPWECVGDDGASPRARWKRIKWRWERMRYWLKHN